MMKVLGFVLIRDAIMAYVFKQFQENSYLHNRIPYTCFTDLTAAYDHIDRDFHFSSIRNRLPKSEFTGCIDLIQDLYRSTKSYMPDQDHSTEIFQTSSGSR